MDQGILPGFDILPPPPKRVRSPFRPSHAFRAIRAASRDRADRNENGDGISVPRTGGRDPGITLLAFLLLTTSPIVAWGKDRPTRFWNLTGDTVTRLSLAPAGTDAYGPDQCANDRDGTVDFDERLPILGVTPGRYDVRLTLRKGRHCRAVGLEIQAGEVFSIEAKDLVGCTP